MKKVLLGTSALAVAALVGGQAAAAEAPSMTINGALDYHVTMLDSDPASSSSFEVASQQYWSEIVFRGEGKTDGGLSYAAEFQWRPISNGLDEAFLSFGDTWGTLVLGDEDGPLSGGELFGFSVLPVGGQDAGQYGSNFAGGTSVNGESEDASKILYKTPNMNGLTASVALTPDTAASFGSGATGTDASTTRGIAASPSTGYVDVMEVGVNYDGSFGGVGVGAHVGYASGDAGSDTLEGAGAMQFGVKVAMSGFTFAVGHGDRGEGGCAAGTSCDQGNFTDLAVVYAMDAMTVGLGYHMGTSESTPGTEVDKTGTYLELGYKVAEGLSAYAGVGMAETESTPASTATDGDDTSIVVGTRITF